MRTIAIFSGVLAVLFATVATPSAARAEDQNSKAAIQKKLESEYQLTKTTDDKSDIVTAGSVLVLHKDKLLMVAVTSAVNPCMNTYKDDKISPKGACGAGEKIRRHLGPLSSHLPGADSAPATRNFVSGEKFWVTKIDVKDNGIVFDFFSDKIPDNDQGVRYKGQLTIPFGALTPTPDEASKVVADVITVAPADDKDSKDAKGDKGDKQQPASQGGQQQAAAPSQPAPAPAVAPAEAAPAPAAAEAPPAPIEPPAPPPAEVSLGQTPAQVVATLGEPAKKAKVGTKDIYFYKDMKVTFVNGKVTDIQ
jgi:hypothetical protein